MKAQDSKPPPAAQTVAGEEMRQQPDYQTELMTAAEQEPGSTVQTAAAMRAVGMLATGIAHDLRNILTSLRMEMAELAPSPCKTSVTRQANRLYALTHSLLALSEEEAFHSGPVDLAEIISFVFRLLREQAETDGIVLRRRMLCEQPMVMGNARRLEHLFVNLLRNALSATAATGGTVTVSVRRESDRLRVDVRDTGPGIDPDILPHLFEPFFTTQLNRSGLGLFSAQRIVQRHGGEIAVKNLKGRGACITVCLPAAVSGPTAEP